MSAPGRRRKELLRKQVSSLVELRHVTSQTQSMVPGTKMNRMLSAAATKEAINMVAMARLFRSFRT